MGIIVWPIVIKKENHLVFSELSFVSTHVLKVAETVQNEPKEKQLEELLHWLWDLESISITDTGTVHESLERNISFEKGRYHVKLPLKEKHDILSGIY